MSYYLEINRFKRLHKLVQFDKHANTFSLRGTSDTTYSHYSLDELMNSLSANGYFKEQCNQRGVTVLRTNDYTYPSYLNYGRPSPHDRSDRDILMSVGAFMVGCQKEFENLVRFSLEFLAEIATNEEYFQSMPPPLIRINSDRSEHEIYGTGNLVKITCSYKGDGGHTYINVDKQSDLTGDSFVIKDQFERGVAVVRSPSILIKFIEHSLYFARHVSVNGYYIGDFYNPREHIHDHQEILNRVSTPILAQS